MLTFIKMQEKGSLKFSQFQIMKLKILMLVCDLTMSFLLLKGNWKKRGTIISCLTGNFPVKQNWFKMLETQKTVNIITKDSFQIIFLLLSLQTHHVYSTFKRCGSDRFYVVSTWNTRVVFVGYIVSGDLQTFYRKSQRRIQNSIKHLRWSILQNSRRLKVKCSVLSFWQGCEYAFETQNPIG